MSVEKFLRQRAVNVVVGGHYTLSNWLDPEGKPRSFACRTSRVSPFRMIVDVPVIGRVGDRIGTYFGDFGRMEGEISDTVAGSFLLELMLTRPQRQRMSDQLIWLEKKQKDPTIKDGRKQARIVPASPHSMLTFADGAMKSCFVIDMSPSGAAVSADVRPEIGTPLAVGACVGRVVRHLDGGFAVKFIDEQGRDVLERRVIRPLQAPRMQRMATLEQRMDRMEEA
ncbi:PilZ domain-containing protein [Tardiphaga sp.]|uniref:PilZ domain-containing protein n=1 Tax=Tardiphaga sp. TaxID=1926292 RepID=UPI00347CFD7B